MYVCEREVIDSNRGHCESCKEVNEDGDDPKDLVPLSQSGVETP